MIATVIFVKDYLYAGNNTFGIIYLFSIDPPDKYSLTDGDIFSVKGLEEIGCTVIPVSDKQMLDILEEHFKENQ